jgi:hypothetical protein
MFGRYCILGDKAVLHRRAVDMNIQTTLEATRITYMLITFWLPYEYYYLHFDFSYEAMWMRRTCWKNRFYKFWVFAECGKRPRSLDVEAEPRSVWMYWYLLRSSYLIVLIASMFFLARYYYYYYYLIFYYSHNI